MDSLTSHTLVSGKVERNEDGEYESVRGILDEIKDKVLVIKDFTVILAKRQEERDEIFSQLRCLYDGYLEYAFGTLKKPISIFAKIGLVAAVTPAIDQYSKLYVQLGERFLKIRHHPNKDKATSKALENLGREEEVRTELATITQRFLTHLSINAPKIYPHYIKEIQRMAHATAILRTPVSINFWRFEINSSLTPSIEYPTRLSKQLLKMAYALTTIRGKDSVTRSEIETVRRVARDTLYPNRIKIIKAMEKIGTKYTTREIAEKTEIPLLSCWRDLKELEYLDVVKYEKVEESPDYYRPTRHAPEKDGWTLKDRSLWVLLPKCILVSGNPSGRDIGNNNIENKGETKASLVLCETKKVLIVKRTKNAEKCHWCDQVASEFEVDDIGEKHYVCKSDLEMQVIPDYRGQGYEIKVVEASGSSPGENN